MPVDVDQIIIQCVVEDDGSLGWEFDAYPLTGGDVVASGAASDLISALEALLDWAKNNAR